MANPTVSTFNPDGLVIDDYPIQHMPVTIASGNTVVRGAALGQITSGGKYILSLSAAVDGSETPLVIAAEDIDASGGDVVGPVYVSGAFDGEKVTYGTGHTEATVNAAFRAAAAPLFLKTRAPL